MTIVGCVRRIEKTGHTPFFVTERIMNYRITSVVLASAIAAGISMNVCADVASESAVSLPNAGIWPDSKGKHVNAHGGNVMFADGKYYWYGEERPDKGFTVDAGVSCYVSDDMVNWDSLGTVMTVSRTPGSDIETGCIIERPKVVYNPATGKYVMWFHLELKGRGYEAARAGVATADTPAGPFEFVGSGRVNPGIMPLNLAEEAYTKDFDYNQEGWTPSWREDIKDGMFTVRDRDGGQMSRDMTIFVDDDGKAYHIYSSEDNLTLQIAELDDTYTRHTGKYIRIFPAGHNEAPAVFKHNGKYWMLTSGCTGWDPNEARLMSADSMLGEWTQHPNPCRGENAEITFGGQSNYVFRLPGDDDTFIAMFDVWRPQSLSTSGHIWLPITFNEEGMPEIHWQKDFKKP